MLTDLPTMDDEGFFELYRAMDLWLRGEPTADALDVPAESSPRF